MRLQNRPPPTAVGGKQALDSGSTGRLDVRCVECLWDAHGTFRF